MKKIWLVWKRGGGAPTVAHESRLKAKAEAQRLCQKTGDEYVILESHGSFTPVSSARYEDHMPEGVY